MPFDRDDVKHAIGEPAFSRGEDHFEGGRVRAVEFEMSTRFAGRVSGRGRSRSPVRTSRRCSLPDERSRLGPRRGAIAAGGIAPYRRPRYCSRLGTGPGPFGASDRQDGARPRHREPACPVHPAPASRPRGADRQEAAGRCRPAPLRLPRGRRVVDRRRHARAQGRHGRETYLIAFIDDAPASFPSHRPESTPADPAVRVERPPPSCRTPAAGK